MKRSTPPPHCGPDRVRKLRPSNIEYHHVGHSFDDPWLTLHNKAEGGARYTPLLFVPSTKPFDLFDPERKSESNSMSAGYSLPTRAPTSFPLICASCAT